MKKTFYSNGKLLITGEYLVLNGVKAFALPTKFGQNLIVEEGENNQIEWTSYDNDQSIWFNETITFDTIVQHKSFNDNSAKSTLTNILHQAYLQNSSFITNANGYKIKTELSFPRFWGLGTSSTLINNVAQWLDCDPYLILKNTFGGSGYDIANAQNNTPITYQLQNNIPKVVPVSFNPTFTTNIYFVYLNKKQSSKSAIEAYRKKQNNIESVLLQIEEITTKCITSNNFDVFLDAIQEHENIMSNVLEEETVKSKYFSDFDGAIKSLGAWGGDFIMVVSKENPTAYFKAKGFETILTYKEMIL